MGCTGYDYQLRYRVWGPLPLRGPDGMAPGYVTLAIYPPPFETTVERHYLPGVGLVREVLIAARGGRRLERRELVLLNRSRSRDSTPQLANFEGLAPHLERAESWPSGRGLVPVRVVS